MTDEFIIPFADDGHDEGDPPSQAEIEHEVVVRLLIFQFHKSAMSHVNIVFELDHAFGSLLQAMKKDQWWDFRLSQTQRDDLLSAIFIAHADALNRLDVDEIAINNGFRAASSLVARWAETDEERSLRHRHFYPDMRAHLDVLHNLVRNAWLLEGAAERHAERLAEVAERRHAGWRKSCERISARTEEAA